MHPILHQNNFSLLPGIYYKRIISLVPSQSEMLYYFGLDERIIGITKFCIHPAHWYQAKERIGSTKEINIEKIKQLQPDLIIANKEENVKEQIEQLAAVCPVYVSDVKCLETALQMILQLGLLVNAKMQSEALVEQITVDFSKLEESLKTALSQQNISTAYLIWHRPFMAVGGNTFIQDMLQRCGIKNVYSQHNRYPEISIEDLQKINPDLLLLSSEPYPFKQQHIDDLQPLLPSTKIMLVDGEMFSWYGSRLIKAAAYFGVLITEFATA